MEPVKPGDKDAWRKKALGLTPGPAAQATPIRTPATIRPPVNPEYSNYAPRPAQPSFGNVPPSRNNPPPTFGKPAPSRTAPWATNSQPKSYYENAEPIMGHVDPEKALKELLDSLDKPDVKRRSRKKKKKAEKEGTPEDEAAKNDDLKQDGDALDDLASAMKGANLDEPEKTDDEEDEEEEEEDGEEEDLSHVDGLKVNLLPHQVDGLNFLLSREEGKNRGGILADDVGLRVLFTPSAKANISSDGSWKNSPVHCVNPFSPQSEIPNPARRHLRHSFP